MKTKRMAAVALCTMMILALGAANESSAQQPPQPTEQHKLLAEDVGVWDAEMKLWMAGPDADPVTSKAVEKNRMLGGMWLISNFEGEVAGQKFTGHGQFGYDPIKEKYTGTWTDSVNPHMSMMTGTYDADSKTMTMNSVGVGPDGQTMKSKNTGKRIDENTRLFAMYMTMPDGNEVKIMEIKYTRRKDGHGEHSHEKDGHEHEHEHE